MAMSFVRICAPVPLIGQSSSATPRSASSRRAPSLTARGSVLVSMTISPGRAPASSPSAPLVTSSNAAADGSDRMTASALAATSAADAAGAPPAAAKAVAAARATSCPTTRYSAARRCRAIEPPIVPRPTMPTCSTARSSMLLSSSRRCRAAPSPAWSDARLPDGVGLELLRPGLVGQRAPGRDRLVGLDRHVLERALHILDLADVVVLNRAVHDRAEPHRPAWRGDRRCLQGASDGGGVRRDAMQALQRGDGQFVVHVGRLRVVTGTGVVGLHEEAGEFGVRRGVDPVAVLRRHL